MMYFDRDGKHNFADTNNVVVGYDSEQCCCEGAGWFVCPDLPTDAIGADAILDFDFEPYAFDQKFISHINDTETLDSGGAVAFKLVAEGKHDRYLVLFNAHNGYYTHGFKMERDGKVVCEGGL